MSRMLVSDIKDSNPAAIEDDGAKRKQILDGARNVFLSKGFDAASMNDIARAAGVSKGTLYVYFENKERLFQAICSEECAKQAEDFFTFLADDTDVESALVSAGIAFVNYLCSHAKVSNARTVIAIAERMPDIGKTYYEAGPANGIARLAEYIRRQIAAGVLAVDDPELAAAQLIESCHATMFRPMMFSFAEPPTQERIEYCVRTAVRTFLRAYRVV